MTAERGPRRRRLVAGQGEDIGHGAAGPEGRSVKAGLVGLGAAKSQTVAAGVDDARIAGPQIGNVEIERAKSLRPQASQEDVRRFNQLEQRFAPLGILQIQGDALLATIVLLHGEVHRAGLAAIADHERAVRIAGSGRLDVDYLGALVGQQHPRARHENVLGQLKNPHARKYATRRHYLGPPAPLKRSGYWINCAAVLESRLAPQKLKHFVRSRLGSNSRFRTNCREVSVFAGRPRGQPMFSRGAAQATMRPIGGLKLRRGSPTMVTGAAMAIDDISNNH